MALQQQKRRGQTRRARKNPKEDVLRADKISKACAMRRAGHSYEEIAKGLGLQGRTSAWRYVQAGIDMIVKEPVEAVYKMELARTDALHKAYWDRALAGDHKAFLNIMRVMERRAALLGLDKPQKVAMTDPTGERESQVFAMPTLTEQQAYLDAFTTVVASQQQLAHAARIGQSDAAITCRD